MTANPRTISLRATRLARFLRGDATDPGRAFVRALYSAVCRDHVGPYASGRADGRPAWRPGVGRRGCGADHATAMRVIGLATEYGRRAPLLPSTPRGGLQGWERVLAPFDYDNGGVATVGSLL